MPAAWFLGAFAVSAVLSWGARWAGRRYGVVDRGGRRALHVGEVPRTGGFAVVPVIAGAGLAAALWGEGDVGGILAPVGLMLAVALPGFGDDWRGLAAGVRLAAQVLAVSVFVVATGPYEVVGTGFGVVRAPAWWGGALVGVAIVWMVNLYNFMDGIDGLAGTQAVAGGGALGVILLGAGQSGLGILSLVAAGAAGGFLLFNGYRATLFLGDGGSTGMGALFGAVIALGASRGDGGHPVALPALVLPFGLFVADATVTQVARMLRRRTWRHEPHREHFYQRPAVAGVAHWQILVPAGWVMVSCGAMGVWFAQAPVAARVWPLAAAGLFIAVWVATCVWVARAAGRLPFAG